VFGYVINRDKMKHDVTMKKCYIVSRRRGISHTRHKQGTIKELVATCVATAF